MNRHRLTLRHFAPLAGCTFAPNLFFKGEQTGNDDVVAYLTADNIIQALSKQGAILSATAQVSDDLRTIAYQKMDEKVSVGCSGSGGVT